MVIVDNIKSYAEKNWKKAAVAVACGVGAYAGLQAARALISVQVISIIAAVAVSGLVYFKVADWEWKKLQAEAEAIKAKAQGLVK